VFLLPLMTWQVGVVFDGTTAWYDNYAGTPPGTLMTYGGGTIPAGFLLCFGQSLLRATYPQLFAAIGTFWGSVDGTHFTLPDSRGRILAGADDMGGSAAGRLTGYTFGHTGGTSGNVVQQANLASFSIFGSGSMSGSMSGTMNGTCTALFSSINNRGGGIGWYLNDGSGGNSLNGVTVSGSVSGSVSGNVTSSSGGSGTPLSVVQPTMAVNVMIRY
jgi:microcystin-dependent protein